MSGERPTLDNPVEALAFLYDEHTPTIVGGYGDPGAPEFVCPRCRTPWPCRGQRALRTIHDALFPEATP